MEVQIQFEEENIPLTYNSQTGYFETTLVASNQGGAKTINIRAEDYVGNTITDTYKIRVLKTQDDEIIQKEDLVYILNVFLSKIYTKSSF